MAWISVHEDVVGSKLRKLSNEVGCSQAEALGILNVIWLWGLKNADQTGELMIDASFMSLPELKQLPRFPPFDKSLAWLERLVAEERDGE